jgi:hypothetical protein
VNLSIKLTHGFKHVKDWLMSSGVLVSSFYIEAGVINRMYGKCHTRLLVNLSVWGSMKSIAFEIVYWILIILQARLHVYCDYNSLYLSAYR